MGPTIICLTLRRSAITTPLGCIHNAQGGWLASSVRAFLRLKLYSYIGVSQEVPRCSSVIVERSQLDNCCKQEKDCPHIGEKIGSDSKDTSAVSSDAAC